MCGIQREAKKYIFAQNSPTVSNLFKNHISLCKNIMKISLFILKRKTDLSKKLNINK